MMHRALTEGRPQDRVQGRGKPDFLDGHQPVKSSHLYRKMFRYIGSCLDGSFVLSIHCLGSNVARAAQSSTHPWTGYDTVNASQL